MRCNFCSKRNDELGPVANVLIKVCGIHFICEQFMYSMFKSVKPEDEEWPNFEGRKNSLQK